MRRAVSDRVLGSTANAGRSDDRSGRVVHERIRDALESRALTGMGSMTSDRPTCVVIDEIDGATGGGESGFVKNLVRFIQDGSKMPRKGPL
jgi:chromosome transmission fidelity protein 18